MLHAHAGILGNTGAAESDGKSDWTWKVTDTAGGVILSVGAVDAADIQKIRALGLHGLLVYGVHHQAHHWLMASGRNPHAH